MNAEKARELFVELVANVPPARWEERLAELAGADEDMCRRVKLLLAAHRDDSFLASPAPALVARIDEAVWAGEAIEPSAVQRRFPAQAAELGTLLGPNDTGHGGAAADATPASPVGSARSSEHAPVDLPEQFGRYRIQRRLGKGGMGTVYLALDTELHRPVALKIPSTEARNDPEIIERFLREARAAAALRHPNICPVYDVGRFQDTPYLTMAYIEGRTLQEVLQAGAPPSPSESAALVRKLALALEVAHRRGLLHRDLKPSNIMIDPAGEPVVMDFGLVRCMEAADVHLTRDGAVLGTPAYMAPEQALPDLGELGPTADVYSIGVILYQMLASRLPFTGNIQGLLFQKISDNPPPPSQFLAGLDARLDAICVKALAKKPAERFSSMAELAAALESCAATPALTDTPRGGVQPLLRPTTIWNPPYSGANSRRPGPLTRRILAVAAALVVVAAAAVFVLTRNRSAAPTNGPEAAKPSQNEKDGNEGNAPHGAEPSTLGKRTPASGDGFDELLEVGGGSSRDSRPDSHKFREKRSPPDSDATVVPGVK